MQILEVSMILRFHTPPPIGHTIVRIVCRSARLNATSPCLDSYLAPNFVVQKMPPLALASVEPNQPIPSISAPHHTNEY